MIMRIWHGRTPAHKADPYVAYIRKTGLEGLDGTAGNRGAWTLRRLEGEVAHFLVVSIWDSMQSIRAFAGAEPERAVYYPEDDDYLLEREPTVQHYEIADAIGRVAGS
jgi:heme-degrading monooxygenase HmoA